MKTLEAINSGFDEELFLLLAKELQKRISAEKGSPEFLAQIQTLPAGLRAMAATYELDVSLALDDLGWHFGNWPSTEFSKETAQGLEELGAMDLAAVFREACQLAAQYRTELASTDWTQWYHGSPFETAMRPLDERARMSLGKKENGVLWYWVDYARRHPECIGAGV